MKKMAIEENYNLSNILELVENSIRLSSVEEIINNAVFIMEPTGTV